MRRRPATLCQGVFRLETTRRFVDAIVELEDPGWLPPVPEDAAG